jgi:hypothetical protein
MHCASATVGPSNGRPYRDRDCDKFSSWTTIRRSEDCSVASRTGPAAAVPQYRKGRSRLFPAVSLGPVTEQLAMNRGIHYPAP